jgi:hypothetical protein
VNTVELAAANIPQNQRDRWQAQGVTMSSTDGSFPIPTVAFLRKAIMSFGRCPPAKQAALVAHIAASAKRLGATNLQWVKNFLSAHSSS